jgi:polyisoprenoid-binding protein YceI
MIMKFLQHHRLLAVSGVAAVIVAVVAFAGWYHFYGDSPPPPVSIDEAGAAVESSPTATAGSAAGGDASQAAGIDGEWTIDGAADSFVGYRIGQELVGVGADEVVGRTSAVEGSAVIDGSSLTAASVTADLTRLDSGESLRDQVLGSQALQTGSFPTASFELAEPLDLPSTLADGQVASVAARGNLSLHGDAQPIEIPLEAQLNNGVLVVVGSLDVRLADYGIEPPSAPVVASVDDHGVIELQLFFNRAA